MKLHVSQSACVANGRSGYAKMLRIMKLLAFMMLAACLSVQAKSYSQKISVSLENASFQQLVETIRSQSGYQFLYTSKILTYAKPVNIDIKEATVEQALNICFRNQPFTYTIIEKTIIVKLKTPAKTTGAETEVVPDPPIEIKGKVTNEKQEPLAGVSVKLRGTNIGTYTANDGSYTIQVPDAKSVLEFSYVGYSAQSVTVGEKKQISISLAPENKNMTDVVVIGYGTQRKSDVTSAVVSVKSDNFVAGTVRDAGQLLQGKVAGLSIALPSGDPTTNSQIMLRGTATLKSSEQPLVLIDGIPGDINSIAPEDIESVDVLKDGSAAAIYGTRGTNGVILIKTKRPDAISSTPVISYNVNVSTQNIARKPDMFNAADYRRLIAQGVAFQDLGGTTDWIDEISRKTPISHVHTLSVKGGSSQTNYVATLNYRKLEGIFLRSDNRTINSRVDINHNMFKNKLRLNFNIINSDNKYETVTLGGLNTNRTVNTPGIDASYNGFIYRQALIRNPTAPVKNADGTWAEQIAIDSYVNPLALLKESAGNTSGQTSRIAGSIMWLPVSNLRLKALVSRNRINRVLSYEETKAHISNIRDGKNGFAHKATAQNIDQLLELTAEYNKASGQHNFSALAGYSYQDFDVENSSLQNFDFPAGNFSYAGNIGLGNAIKNGQAVISSSKYVSNLLGFFGRATYSFRDKYLLMANLRYEASSKLVGTLKPWGLFPAISAGWKINKESFMQPLSFINELKLRAGYGVTGTAPDAYFLGVSRLGYDGGYALIDGQWVPTLGPVSNPNPYLKWEEKHETNIGLDFSLFNRRLSGSIDYYIRRTKGLLYDYPVPSPPNLYSTTTANVGTMENKGLEVLVNYAVVEKKNFSWNTNINFSTNSNKLVSLTNDLYKLTNDFFNTGYTGSPVQTYTHRVQVGQAIGNFYGYKVVDVTEDGNWVYLDKDGKQTTVRGGEENKQVLGNGLPKYYLAWNNTVRFKNLDLSVNMRGAFKYQVLNFVRMYYENPGTTQYNQLRSAQDKVFGKAVLNKNVPLDYNSYYVENGDFWKIDNITVGYNFKSPAPGVIKNLRLYASIINAAVITGYKGNDPEVNRLGLTAGNDDRDKYPATRVYTAGLNVIF
ncbi:MAG TPA: SusC/RagA family TonB-linked outer membrane protein [Ferruginibacter sp.]|nr:SusC/RagA family TonB-linked outer membrane protein [Ferruginibacter sp.]HMP19944.1 SusC/RagA family TonB-linked outer membrane protein [Ferruginibacter sp.]